MDRTELYELLNKETLSAEAKLLLDKIIAEDPEAAKIARLFQSVKNIAEQGSHLGAGILGEYILLKNGQDDDSNLSPKLLPKIEDHLRKCELCKNNFITMNKEFESVDNFITGSILPEKQTGTVTEESGSAWWQMQKHANFKKTVYSIAALCLIYFSLFAFYNITTPEYKKEFDVFQANQKFIARGRISSEFQKGIAELDKHNFEQAVKELNSDIKDNPNDKTIFYTYFILGKTYLEAAKSNVLGLYNDYDKQKLKKSIEAFQKSIEKNKSPEFKHLNYDAYYFIARDFLLLDNFDEAKKYLKLVIDNKGSFKKDAEELLKSFES